MAKEKTVSSDSIWAALFQFGVYKPTQGRVARQLTFVALGVVGTGLASFQLWMAMKMSALPSWMHVGREVEVYLDIVLPLLFLVAGLWFSFRAVCVPRFADFLIAVEAEMNKVSWPTRDELIRSSVVVIAIIIILAALLSTFDLVWYLLFHALGVIQS